VERDIRKLSERGQVVQGTIGERQLGESCHGGRDDRYHEKHVTNARFSTSHGLVVGFVIHLRSDKICIGFIEKVSMGGMLFI
jgi:hypothetical protein